MALKAMAALPQRAPEEREQMPMISENCFEDEEGKEAKGLGYAPPSGREVSGLSEDLVTS